MGECLWKVTQVLSTRADFLREKTEVVGVDESFVEKRPGLIARMVESQRGSVGPM
jgi:hypothetical protein